MPRNSVQEWVSCFKCFATDGKVVFCSVCNKQVTATRKFLLEQHVKSAMHVNRSKKAKPLNQKLLTNLNFEDATQKVFCQDLCEAMVAANIPWNKLEIPKFKSFLEKYMNRQIPSESTIRKGYLHGTYQKTIQKIRENIDEEYIWFAVDETIDDVGRSVANIIVGKLTDDYNTSHLLASKVLEKCNNSTIARFVNESLHILWPNGIKEERVLIMYSDAAPYMLKAARALQIFYPSLLHFTCMAHGFHRIAEHIRSMSAEVDRIISTVKKVFLKSPLRVEAYKNACNLPLPPQPVLTRWGTWLNAALFYADNFSTIKEIIDSFDNKDSSYIKAAQEAMSENNVIAKLAYIKTHFSNLPEVIKKLEGSGTPLVDSFQIISCFCEQLYAAPGQLATTAAEKMRNVLKKNPAFEIFDAIRKILEGTSTTVPTVIKPEIISKFKFAPVTSCDVERSFSSYKNILCDNRHRLKPENIEKLLTVYCNKL